jgi:hypothetical protein
MYISFTLEVIMQVNEVPFNKSTATRKPNGCGHHCRDHGVLVATSSFLPRAIAMVAIYHLSNPVCRTVSSSTCSGGITVTGTSA